MFNSCFLIRPFNQNFLTFQKTYFPLLVTSILICCLVHETYEVFIRDKIGSPSLLPCPPPGDSRPFVEALLWQEARRD